MVKGPAKLNKKQIERIRRSLGLPDVPDTENTGPRVEYTFTAQGIEIYRQCSDRKQRVYFP